MKLYRGFKALLMGVGAYKVGEVAYTVGKDIYLTQAQEKEALTDKYGHCYAVVAESTGDIGASYAIQLARHNFNLVLISKDVEAMKLQKEDLEKKYEIKVKAIELDFTRPHVTEDLERIKEHVRGLDIGVFVNSVEHYQLQRFENQYPQEIRDAINSNILTPTLLLNTFIPKLLQREKRSCVINVGNELGDHPAGFLSLSSAAKAYVNTLSRSLGREYEGRLDVVTALPGPLETKTYKSYFSKGEEDLQYLDSLKHSLGTAFTKSSTEDSAEAILSSAGERREVPGTKVHLLYYIAQSIISNTAFRTPLSAEYYHIYGEVRPSNVPPKLETDLHLQRAKLWAPFESSTALEYLHQIQSTAGYKARKSQAPIVVPQDITKTLSNDFLLPLISLDFSNEI